MILKLWKSVQIAKHVYDIPQHFSILVDIDFKTDNLSIKWLILIKQTIHVIGLLLCKHISGKIEIDYS